MRKNWIILGLPVALAVAACGDDERPVYPSFDQSVLEIAESNGETTTFAAAIRAAELTDAFDGTLSILTVFAPTNAAFSAIPAGPLGDIVAKVGAGTPLEAAEISALSAVIRYHAIGGNIPASIVAASDSLTTITSTAYAVSVDDGGTVTLKNQEGSANIVSTNFRAFNGILHTIDTVLIPPRNIVQEAAQAGFNTLLAAATAAGLDETLADADADPVTVFAPSDAAFAAVGDVGMVDPDVVANILLHHVVPGIQNSTIVAAADMFTTAAKTSIAVAGTSSITVGGAPLSSTLDIVATNGLIHGLDGVMVPPTILEVATNTSTLSTLVTAVGASSAATQMALAPNTLMGDAPITVFAPQNGAFDGIDLGALTQEQIDEILANHVVMGQTLSGDLGDLEDGTAIMTLTGTITVNVSDDGVTLTDGQDNIINIVEADIRTLTGVVHLIDGVLLPEAGM